MPCKNHWYPIVIPKFRIIRTSGWLLSFKNNVPGSESDQAEHLRIMSFLPQTWHLSVSSHWNSTCGSKGRPRVICLFWLFLFIIKWKLMLSSLGDLAWGWYAVAMQINNGPGPLPSLGLESLGPASCCVVVVPCCSGWSPSPLPC